MRPRVLFAARMAWREMRGARRHFAYFLACIAVGVAALVGVQSFADSLAATVARSAKGLLGADVEIRGSRPLSEAAAAIVAGLAKDGVAATRTRELAAMAQVEGDGSRTLLVELKAVEPAYPFYGRLVTEPDRPLASLTGEGRALVHPSLLSRLRLSAGDRIRIGDAVLTISGAIVQEPDRSLSAFSLGPRVLVAAPDLDRTGLIQLGSRVRYRTLLRLPEGLDAAAFRDELARLIPDPSVRVLTYAESQPGFRRFWDQLAMYLGLIGLVALMVGGIGVAVSVRAFVNDKMATIAALKCLGASWREVFLIYLGLTAALGLAGSVAGAALGSLLQPALGPALAHLLPMKVALSPSPRAIANGLGVGVGVTLLFSVWPLLEIRRVPPALLLRRQVQPGPPGRVAWLAAPLVVGGLAAVALWQAGSWRIGGLFVAGLAAALAALTVSARLVIAAARAARGGPLVWRQALANLHRPGNQAGAVLVSLGLAVTLIVAVVLLEASLRGELRYRSDGAAPAFFFVDIQPDQAAPFERLMAARDGGAPPEMIPVVRARLRAVNDEPVPVEPGAHSDAVWYRSREYMLTWAAAPPRENAIVAGRWWTAEEAAREPLISVEEEVARLMGVGIGGRLAFDVQGVTVSGRVANIRRVDWQSLNANFFVVFSQGALAGAPATYIATARVAPGEEDRVQSAVVAAFPNVTAIPVREMLERVAAVLDQIAFAMRLVAGWSVVSGLVVMAGALSITRSRRVYQSVILKALGATRGLVARIFAVEYALLGAAAGVCGTALAAAMAWAILRWALDVRWAWAPMALAGGVVAATALAVAVGFLGTRRLLGQRPLGALRSE